jgi:hypothetical protein
VNDEITQQPTFVDWSHPVPLRRKTVCLVRKDLEPRTVANVIGHSALALGAQAPAALVMNPRLIDRDRLEHNGVSGWPFVVLTTRASKLTKTVSEVTKDNRLWSVAFMLPMLTTSSDEELIAEVLEYSTDDIEWLGVIAYGDPEHVDRHFGDYSLWSPVG